MKTPFYLLLALLLCWSATCSSQNTKGPKTKDEFNLMRDAKLNKMKQALDEKKYTEVEQGFWDIIAWYEQLPNSEQKEINLGYGDYYYSIACYQSLQNKKKEALENFEKAYQNGFSDYYHTLKDSDLDNIRNEKAFKETQEKLREVGDYLYILQQSADYTPNSKADTLPRFVYMDANDSNLVRVRQYFKLDSVAGTGDELSKIKNILTYIHDKIMHDGEHDNPDSMTSIGLAEACKDGSRGLNCRGLATVLNECYLSMGFKSRLITCMPKKYISDCHVINVVYSKTLDKWVWVDPTQNAWVMDENGTMLSVQEVRERMRQGLPLVLNKEANWNNRQTATKEDYLDYYMTKNLYYINCSLRSEFGTEDKRMSRSDYVALMPTGFSCEMEAGRHIVNDDNWFWQSPYRE